MPLSRDKIEALMQRSGLTLEEAGRRYGFTAHARQQWYALMNGTKGDPKLATVEKMCQVLGCSILDILDDNSPAMPRSTPRLRRAAKAEKP